jgi:hypothetical protein
MGEFMYRSIFFLDLGTSWRWVVSFTPRPFYLRGNSLRYTLDRRLGGPQSQSGWRGEEKILDHTGIELRPLGRAARGQSLYRLRYPGFYIYIYIWESIVMVKTSASRIWRINMISVPLITRVHVCVCMSGWIDVLVGLIHIRCLRIYSSSDSARLMWILNSKTGPSGGP